MEKPRANQKNMVGRRVTIAERLVEQWPSGCEAIVNDNHPFRYESALDR